MVTTPSCRPANSALQSGSWTRTSNRGPPDVDFCRPARWPCLPARRRLGSCAVSRRCSPEGTRGIWPGEALHSGLSAGRAAADRHVGHEAAAPAEIRGPFKPIPRPSPGMQFCEHLPRLAQQAGDLAILRSVTFPNNDHPFMIYHTLTGRESRVPLGANTVLPPSRSDDPHMGSVVARFKHRDPARAGLRGDSRSARADVADAGFGRRPGRIARRAVRSAGHQRRSARAAGRH